jgi:hypothetical protein
MKKFIMNNIQEEFVLHKIFPCCSSLKILRFRLLVLLICSFSFTTHAQLVGDATVKANFGVEADVYANQLQFPNADVPPIPLPVSALGIDDWFKLSNDLGSGKGVIDQSNAVGLKATIQAQPNNNYAFEKRQSVTTPTLPFPYPIIDGYLWIDSVYGRDNISAQGTNDLTIFGGTKDKNSDNPISWTLGSGSVPQKTDIVDVYAHLRGVDPKAPTDLDPRPFNTLWAFGGGSLRDTSGSKHIDFEFFRTLVGYSAGASDFTNTGTDGGRTAWTFDGDGDILVPGTIIISIDYEGGGTRPDVRIRVWMNSSILASFNTLPNRPFNIDVSSFESGLNSGTFGYVRIEARNNSTTSIFGRVNTEGATLATPWGTLEGENAMFNDNYSSLQFVEFGINLTAFGLDRRGETDPCSNILGSLLVKTRSSAGGQSDSFTSELKDFAGPYIFGRATNPMVSLAQGDPLSCTNKNVTLTATVNESAGLTINFYGPDPDGDNNDNYGPLVQSGTGLTYSTNIPGTYTVVAEAVAFPGCKRIDRVTILPFTPNELEVSCPQAVSLPACTSQEDINSAFNTWKSQFIVNNNGGAGLTQSPTAQEIAALQAPNKCGGSVSVTLKASDICNTEESCTSTFKVDADTENPTISVVSSSDPKGACNPTIVAPTFKVEDGCDGNKDIVGVADKDVINGCFYSRTYRANYTDACNNAATEVTVTYTWKVESPVDVSGPSDVTYSRCDIATQEDLKAKFDEWLASFKVINASCGAEPKYEGNTGVPLLCEGGKVTVKLSIANNCSSDEVQASFELTGVERLAIKCPTDVDLTCSQNPQEEFNTWISSFSYTGGCNPSATDLSSYVLPLPGQTLSVTYEVKDNCDTKSCTVTFKVPDCNTPHCTYTQGYYGDYNGSACDIDGNPTTDHQIMVNAINQAGGEYNFGSMATGNYFKLKASDVYGNPNIASNNVFVMLPGGGSPRALAGYATYDDYSTWSDSDPLTKSGANKGNINNNLLSQTMTMFFNLSVDNTLGGYALKSKFATSDVSCGSDVAIPNTYKEFKISQLLIDYLNANYVGGANVSNLFALANKALGGENIGNLSPSIINSAVDNINRGFDACRVEVPLIIIVVKPIDPIYETSRVNSNNDPIFSVYPVPFKETFTLKYEFDYKSEVKIQIFDTKGSLLQFENDTNPYLNKEISIRPRFNRGEGQMFFIKVITDRGVSIKKVLSSK